MNKHKHDMQKGRFTSRDHLSLALVSPLGTVVDAPAWLTGITCTQSIWSIRHSQQAHVISFTAYQEVHSLCLLVVCILLLLLEQSLTLPMLPSPILNARIRREIKSINPLLGLLNLSHTVHHSPWPCNSSSQLTTCSVLFTFLSRWLWADPHHNLPNPWCLFVVHDKNLCSHL